MCMQKAGRASYQYKLLVNKRMNMLFTISFDVQQSVLEKSVASIRSTQLAYAGVYLDVFLKSSATCSTLCETAMNHNNHFP